MDIRQGDTFNDHHEKKDHGMTNMQQIKYTIHMDNDQGPQLEFNSQDISGVVTYDDQSDVFTINGLFDQLRGQKISYWAANPISRNYSYAGSALPYPNPKEAYENTSNQGEVQLDDNGRFSLRLDHPSGYYVHQGKTLLKPHVHFKVPGTNEVYTIIIADDFPYRSLRNLPNRPNRTIGR
jgi:hypothetical protein